MRPHIVTTRELNILMADRLCCAVYLPVITYNAHPAIVTVPGHSQVSRFVSIYHIVIALCKCLIDGIPGLISAVTQLWLYLVAMQQLLKEEKAV